MGAFQQLKQITFQGKNKLTKANVGQFVSSSYIRIYKLQGNRGNLL